ncbi:D-alanyl-D-alanine carboxypeptidase family protein [Candidatus Woesearchaeota archaeon]|nr:D-alanyl-D-alanine carboxypeptidase family protein [Candidatus Woesearchaeota archaeon]
MKSRKAALVYNWTLTLMVIGILAWTLIQFSSKYSKFEPLGTKQLTIFKTYSKAESALFYIDQSAKYSLQQSIYELAANGVSVSEFDINEININQPFILNKCGKFKDAYVWYELKKDASNNYVQTECFDKSPLITNLVYFFNKNLNQYLTASPYNIPINNYDYEVKNNLEIIGKAKFPLKFDILKDESKQSIKKPVEARIEQKNSEDFTQSTENLCAKGVKCVLTDEAFALLLEAQKIAKQKSKTLVVNSAYRSQDEQIAVWNRFASTYPDAAERRKRVCDPYNQKCPHTTGNAVDVVFKDRTTATMSNIEWLALHQIMSEAGWVRYGIENRYDLWEPWHFECCGTDRHKRAQSKGVTAIV